MGTYLIEVTPQASLKGMDLKMLFGPMHWMRKTKVGTLLLTYKDDFQMDKETYMCKVKS